MPHRLRTIGLELTVDGLVVGGAGMLSQESVVEDDASGSAIGWDFDGGADRYSTMRMNAKTNVPMLVATCQGTGDVGADRAETLAA